MTTQHTPGPWAIDDDGEITSTNAVGNITEIGQIWAIYAKEEEEANIRLIRSAPELLALLTRAANMLDVLGSREHEDFVAECFDLISKVNGEAA